ncbi:MAG: OmpH family outer membrane protein [Polyangiales bacterium]|nr:OmpH family outer membrane protein [Myxococcales bacterium]
MQRQRLIPLFLATVFVLGATSQAFADTKIAVVDLQRAMNDTEDGRKAKAELQRLFKKRQEELDAKQNGLKKMKDDIEKQKDVLARDVLQKKFETYQKQFVELQTVYVEYQRELAGKEAQLTKGILERMQRIVQRIGQANGYTVVLEKSEGGVVWVPSNLDLTDEVIQRYNKGEGKN